MIVEEYKVMLGRPQRVAKSPCLTQVVMFLDVSTCRTKLKAGEVFISSTNYTSYSISLLLMIYERTVGLSVRPVASRRSVGLSVPSRHQGRSVRLTRRRSIPCSHFGNSALADRFSVSPGLVCFWISLSVPSRPFRRHKCPRKRDEVLRSREKTPHLVIQESKLCRRHVL